MQTILEGLVRMVGEGAYEKSTLSNIRIQIFLYLQENRGRPVTINEIIQNVNVECNPKKVRILMNDFMQYELATYDFITRTYKYKDGINSMSLSNTLTMIKAL
jgi:hypothetical protein